MKKEAIALMLLLALAMMPILATPTSAHTIGTPYPTGSSYLNTPPVDWVNTTAYQILSWAPQYLQLQTSGTTTITSNTKIIVQGTDTYGQDIEATAYLPAGTHSETYAPLLDYATSPPEPVAFAKITNIFQQNATHNNQFYVWTFPYPKYGIQNYTYPQYLGEYHVSTGWSPGVYTYTDTPPYSNATGSPVHGGNGLYLVANGPGVNCTYSNCAPEPITPDPLRIYFNWHESDGDLYPDPNELGVSTSSMAEWLYIEGLDQTGNKVAVNVTITPGVAYQDVPTVSCSGYNFTFSTICSIQGVGSDSFYIFTNPEPKEQLFTYTTLIDHMNIYANSYDLLANPANVVSVAPTEDGPVTSLYPGVTNITVTLVDADGNLINGAPSEPIDVNFATTGGTIEPSCDVWIVGTCYAQVNLTADTNPRTVNVTADADVPKCTAGTSPLAPVLSPELDLFAWTELDFDGINSVFAGLSWPIHEMYWGYHTGLIDPTTLAITWNPEYTAPIPPEPPLPPELGGPNATATGYETMKLNGPIYEVSISLYVGCNLISCPVEPMMNYNVSSLYGYYSPSFETMPNDQGIPMSLLFGKTDSESIEMVWWYRYGYWYYYIPATNTYNYTGTSYPCPVPYFIDGLGYWIMCDKPCTLELSGVEMQNGPFTPPQYHLEYQLWSLRGVTSIVGIPDWRTYFESALGSDYTATIGPIWVWYARYGVWVRDPSWGLWPGEAFWVYSSLTTDQYIAP